MVFVSGVWTFGLPKSFDEMYKLLSDLQRELRANSIYTRNAAQCLDYLERLFAHSQAISIGRQRQGAVGGEAKPEDQSVRSGADR